MAKKRTYRRPPRAASHRYAPPTGESVDIAASRLASGATVEGLRLLVTQSREQRERADQEAQDRPGPEALDRFRRASERLDELERALALAEKSAARL